MEENPDPFALPVGLSTKIPGDSIYSLFCPFSEGAYPLFYGSGTEARSVAVFSGMPKIFGSSE